jgi:hypothetical protein
VSVEDGIPETGQATEAPHDWEKDYKALQAEYTRSQQALKDEQAAWDDEQALIARIAEKHPHMIQADEEEETEPEYEVEDDDPRFQKLGELEQRTQAQDAWIADQQAAQAQAAFEREVVEEAGERSLGKPAKDWILQETLRLGNGRANLAKATKAWLEYEDSLREPAPKPNAPHVLKGGKAASETPDFSQMSQDQVNEYMAERAKALMS